MRPPPSAFRQAPRRRGGTPLRAPRNRRTGRTKHRPAKGARSARRGGRWRHLGRHAHRGLDVAGDDMRHLFGERAGEFVRRRADQIGLGDAGKIFFEAVDAALFRLAAGDPVDRVEGRERLRRRVGVGSLRIVDEEHGAAPADDLHPMRETGKALHRREDDAAVEAERLAAPQAHGGVLPIVRTAKRRQAGEEASRRSPSKSVPSVSTKSDASLVAPDGDGDEMRPALALQRRGDRLHRRLVDADDRPCLGAHVDEDARLGLGVAAKVAVTVEMIGGEVQPDRHVGPEAARQIELIGRHLEHIDAALPRRLEVERGAADIAADRGRAGDRRECARSARSSSTCRWCR